MKAKTRRKLVLGARALIFCRVHPTPSGGIGVSLTLLEQLLLRARDLALQQREGTVMAAAAAARKRDLRRILRRDYLGHLREVARSAEPELPGLWRRFILPRGTIPYRIFRAAAAAMAAEAESRKEALLKYGLDQPILAALAEKLEEFDRAVEQRNRGHLLHVGAGADLDRVAERVVLVVRAMHGVNQVRFVHSPDILAAWESVRHAA